ncbi:hypothetical protein Pta02_27690 [Planobispora takensis]|uniref:Uncharacterized protein n=1 Tax=Planobispora takensis TaxID=1367882 RepID=A0A8J3WSU6_9ACTN|nr:hypothetical protein Pta02_27690 [Planobispora takensis]
MDNPGMARGTRRGGSVTGFGIFRPPSFFLLSFLDGSFSDEDLLRAEVAEDAAMWDRWGVECVMRSPP